ncbi:MAG: N-acetyl-D-Glu racemase DgcA [Sphingomonadaceae bacterium]
MQRTLDARHDAYALARAFRIARGTKTVADVVTVTLGEDGAIGRGEGVPYARYGETIEDVLAAIAGVQPLLEQGMDRHALLERLSPGAARNAIDCALWDLESRLAGLSVAERIGAPEPLAQASAITIGIDTPDAMAAAARAIAGAPLVKIKIDADDPARRIAAVRAAAPDAALIVDPNESWDRALLEAIADTLIAADVALIEQPVPAETDSWLEGFAYPIAIAADEAVHTDADLDRIAARYSVVNVKLDKAGGLTAALDLAHAARVRGLGLMTGCMISSSLSIAPAFHIARMSDFVDLDGPLWLADDHADGVSDSGGILSPPAAGFWGAR